MHSLFKLKQALDKGEECSELIESCIKEHTGSKQNERGLTTLLLRYYIIHKKTDKITDMLYNNKLLMKRDYLTCLEYFLETSKESYDIIQYIYSMIHDIETKDIDIMIKNGWFELIKKFEGYPVKCSYTSNMSNTRMLKRYMFDVSKMKEKYFERIKNKEEIDVLLKGADVLIDGANMAHLKGSFDFSILPKLIIELERLGYSPRIILHERHIITDSFIKKYLIRTPIYRNDDDYMIYGMLQYNMMVLSNDMFRDHLKDMDVYTKCYTNSMTMKYYNNTIIIPTHSKCIQVIDDIIYIPCEKSFLKLN